VLADALRDRSLRVVATIRLLQRGPRPLWRMWRRVLIAHGCDIGHDARIGPALCLPTPVGVVVGRRAILGTGVTLHEHTCVTPTRTRWQPTDAAGGLRIGDAVQLRAGAAAFGELTVAPGTVVAPRAVVLRDVGPASAPPPPPVACPHHGPDRMAALVRADARRAPVTSAAFQAALLVRAATAGPRALRRPARAALRALHHIYVDGDATIGPGLALPRPVGVHLGAGILVGANVTIEDRVTIEAGAPAVPDGATLATATVLTAVHQTASRLSRPLNVAGPAAAETPRRKQVPLS
jgi:serine acetyltransferase